MATHEFTQCLSEAKRGDPHAMDRAFSIVYEQLRRIALSQLSPARGSPTLSATALVHEVFLKVSGADGDSIEDRAHFFSLAARAMKQILVDHARRHLAEKRGGQAVKVSLEDTSGRNRDLPAKDGISAEVLALHSALEKLRCIDERVARVVELRFFAGLEEKEIAGLLGFDERTVRRDWQKARAWLQTELAAEP